MAKKPAKPKPAKKGQVRKAKAADSSHVPLDLSEEKEKAAEIVQQVEQEITGAVTENEPAMPAGNQITLEPLPRKEQRMASEEERAYEEMLQAESRVKKKEQPAGEKWEVPPAGVANAEDVKPGAAMEGPAMPGLRKGVFAKSLVFGLAGALIAGFMFGMAGLDAWLVGVGFAVIFLITTSVAYLYLNYTSR